MTNLKQIISEENTKLKNQLNTGELTKKQIDFINMSVEINSWTPTTNWTYENGVVNVDGDVNFVEGYVGTIPVQFGKVTGGFYCNWNDLTSLRGCPYEVGTTFECWQNKLTSLEYIPKKIGEQIYCHPNKFILNDKLFEDIRDIGGKKKIGDYDALMMRLFEQIPIQFGITDKKIITGIWRSYLDILEGKNK